LKLELAAQELYQATTVSAKEKEKKKRVIINQVCQG
jgi:hypothetical protein